MSIMSEPTAIVDICEQGHKFAKLNDHPKRDGLPRCPHCMAQGLDTLRTCQPAQQEYGRVHTDGSRSGGQPLVGARQPTDTAAVERVAIPRITDEMVERGARKLAYLHCSSPDQWPTYADEARDCITAAMSPEEKL